VAVLVSVRREELPIPAAAETVVGEEKEVVLLSIRLGEVEGEDVGQRDVDSMGCF
jgi:hypothetical protein